MNKNPKILFMGDSITALGAWVKIFNEIIRPEYFVNIAVSSATWQDWENTKYDGIPLFNGPDNNLHNTIGNQVEIVLRAKDDKHTNFHYDKKFEDFDVIIISAGTNGGEVLESLDAESINKQFYDIDGKILPLAKVDRTTWVGAMRYAYDNLRYIYPRAKIFFCSPIQGAEEVRTYKSIEYKSRLMKAICDRISDVHFINTFNCGICGIYEIWQSEGRDLCDGLHPNWSGAEKIALFNAREIKNYLYDRNDI